MFSLCRPITMSRAFSTSTLAETFTGAVGNTPLVRSGLFTPPDIQLKFV